MEENRRLIANIAIAYDFLLSIFFCDLYSPFDQIFPDPGPAIFFFDENILKVDLIPKISPNNECNNPAICLRHKASFRFHAIRNMLLSRSLVIAPPIRPGNSAHFYALGRFFFCCRSYFIDDLFHVMNFIFLPDRKTDYSPYPDLSKFSAFVKA